MRLVLLQLARFGPGSLRSQLENVISVSVHVEEAPGRVPDAAEGVVVKGGGSSGAHCRHEYGFPQVLPQRAVPGLENRRYRF